jgi:hypothetical protein
LQLLWGGFHLPIGWKFGGLKVSDEGLFNFYFEYDVFSQQPGGIEVHEDLDQRKRS